MKINPDPAATQPRFQSLLILALLLTLAFGLAAHLGPRVEARLAANGESEDDPMKRWLGDSRRLFANSFYVKADAYFHSGYYPTIYDNNAPFKTAHMAEDSGAAKSQNTGDENNFLGKPHDWIERVNRSMFPSHHTHLDEGGVDGNGAAEVKEILPWLKISEDLDSHRIETYLVAAYWLRVRMHMIKEAEEFLRDGLRANPGNPAILYELGQLYLEGRKNPNQARNIYLAALTSWNLENAVKAEKDQDKFELDHIASALAKLEEQEHNVPKAIEYLKLLKTVSPSPDAIQKKIDELEQKAAAKP